MACEISFGQRFVQLNNMQFASLIAFAIEVAEQTCGPEEQRFVERMKHLDQVEFWPGRGIDIGEDFPDLAEQKFWCRVFFDVARAILDRRIGNHEHHFWQAQRIQQAYGSASLFEEAVRASEPRWSAGSLDHREFDKFVADRNT